MIESACGMCGTAPVQGFFCHPCNTLLGQYRDNLYAALHSLMADSSSDDEDSRAAEPHGEVSPPPDENSGSTPTAAPKPSLPAGMEPELCIWCLKQPCICAKLQFPESRRSGTDVG